VTPAGSTSVNTVLTEVSLPALLTTIVYWRTSPGKSAPPLTSTADLTDVLKSGLKVEIEVMNPAR
jgi:hypothetical protein